MCVCVCLRVLTHTQITVHSLRNVMEGMQVPRENAPSRTRMHVCTHTRAQTDRQTDRHTHTHTHRENSTLTLVDASRQLGPHVLCQPETACVLFPRPNAVHDADLHKFRGGAQNIRGKRRPCRHSDASRRLAVPPSPPQTFAHRSPSSPRDFRRRIMLVLRGLNKR